jgi:uncharacterized protein (TIRG00374 family)
VNAIAKHGDPPLSTSDRTGPTTASPSFSASRLIAAGLGVAAIGVLIWLAHPRQVVRSLDEVSPLFVVLALLLNVPLVLVRALRAQLVVQRLGHRLTLLRMLPVQLLGQTSSSLSPAASGDLVRAYLWRRHEGVPVRDGVAAVVFERVLGLLLLLAATAALLLALHLPPQAGAVVALTVLLVPPALFWAAARLPESIERALLGRLGRLPVAGRLAEQLLAALAQLRVLAGTAGLLARSTVLTLIGFSLSGLQVWLLVTGLGFGIPFGVAVGSSAASEVAGILSTLPFGLGPADVIVVTLLAKVGVAVTAAASVAVLMRAVTTLPMALAGLAAYLILERARVPALAGAE